MAQKQPTPLQTEIAHIIGTNAGCDPKVVARITTQVLAALKKHPPRVLIGVEGGVVQSTSSDGPVLVLVKDMDNIEQGDAARFLDSEFSPPDTIYPTPAELDLQRVEGVVQDATNEKE